MPGLREQSKDLAPLELKFHLGWVIINEKERKKGRKKERKKERRRERKKERKKERKGKRKKEKKKGRTRSSQIVTSAI